MNRPDTHVKDLTLLEKYMAKSRLKPEDFLSGLCYIPYFYQYFREFCYLCII